MKNKSGQISTFIIAGIVLLLGAIFFFVTTDRGTYESSKGAEELQSLPSELQPVKTYIEECIKIISESSLELMGLQGGHIILPAEHLTTNYSKIGYGYYDGSSGLPSLAYMEKQLEQSIEDNLLSCINSSSIKAQFEIEATGIKPKVTIFKNEVAINADGVVQVRRGQSITRIKGFRRVIPIKIGHIHSILASIVNKTIEDSQWIDLAYLSDFDLSIDILPHDRETLIYAFEDKSGTKTYTFLSAFRFMKNNAPFISIKDKIWIADGEAFSLQINVSDPENDNFTCYDDTALFDISDNCTISFTPDVPDLYNVTITAIDSKGSIAKKNLSIEVKEQ